MTEPEKENIPWWIRCRDSFRNNVPFWILLFSFIPAVFWSEIFASGTLLRWWKSFKPYLPEHFYYPPEEFFALHAHHNELPPRFGFYCIIIAAIVLWILKKQNKIKGNVSPLLSISIAVIFLLFSGCLCIPKERSSRNHCYWDMNYFYAECQKHPEWKKRFPEAVPELEGFCRKRNWIYPGAGKEVSGVRYIVLEDPPDTHAGDARHRLWSDGTIEIFYGYRH